MENVVVEDLGQAYLVVDQTSFAAVTSSFGVAFHLEAFHEVAYCPEVPYDLVEAFGLVEGEECAEADQASEDQ